MPAKQLEINKKNNFSPPYFKRMYVPEKKTGSLRGTGTKPFNTT